MCNSCSRVRRLQNCIFFYPLSRIAKLDGRIGNNSVSASRKWEPMFKECETALGFTGDAANDVYSAWSRLATESFNRKVGEGSPPQVSPRGKRSNSLTGMQGKTVKVPVGLIPLERARARTLKPGLTGLQDAAKSLATTSTSGIFPVSNETKVEEVRPLISRPINIEDSSLCCSYPSGHAYRLSRVPYAPHADISESPPRERGQTEQGGRSQGVTRRGSDMEYTIRQSFDLTSTIRSYVDKVAAIKVV